MLSWLFVGALFLLCGVLGVLQYRWIGEVSLAARERLQASLRATLQRLSRDFNSEINMTCRGLLSATSQPDARMAEAELAARYEQLVKEGRHSQIFRRLAIAVPQSGTVALRNLDLQTGVYAATEWPASWKPLQRRLESRLSSEPWENRRPPGPRSPEDGLVFEVPIFRMEPPGGRPAPFPRRETAWLIFELDAPYIRDTILPEILQRYLGSGGNLDYQVEILTRSNPPALIYKSDADQAGRIAGHADASVSLLDLQFGLMLRRPGPPGMRDRGLGPPGPG